MVGLSSVVPGHPGSLICKAYKSILSKKTVNQTDNIRLQAWRLYEEERCLELLDEAAMDSYNQSEVFRTVQIGLLCVQPYPEDRPTMSMVVLMLSSDIQLPQPKQPTFFTERNQFASEFSKLSEMSSSVSTSSVFTPR